MVHSKTRKEYTKLDVEGAEIVGNDIKNLAKKLGKSPSGQDVIDFINDVNSAYLHAYVTGKPLQSAAPNITDDARTSLGQNSKEWKSHNNFRWHKD